MGSFGLPELLVFFAFAVFWIAPIAAAVWALVTLRRIRGSQDVIERRLDAIEKLLQRPQSA